MSHPMYKDGDFGFGQVAREPTCSVELTYKAIRKLAAADPEADRKLRQQAPQAFVGEAVRFAPVLCASERDPFTTPAWHNSGPEGGLWLSRHFDWKVTFSPGIGQYHPLLVGHTK